MAKACQKLFCNNIHSPRLVVAASFQQFYKVILWDLSFSTYSDFSNISPISQIYEYQIDMRFLSWFFPAIQWEFIKASPETITYQFWRSSLINFMCCQRGEKEHFILTKVAEVFLDELKNQTQSSLGLNMLKVAPLIPSFLCFGNS